MNPTRSTSDRPSHGPFDTREERSHPTANPGTSLGSVHSRLIGDTGKYAQSADSEIRKGKTPVYNIGRNLEVSPNDIVIAYGDNNIL